MRPLILVASLLLWAGVCWGSGSGPLPANRHSQPAAIELMVNGASHDGNLPSAASNPLDRGFAFSRPRQRLYLAEVWPGNAYTLGLTIPAGNHRLAVSLFDAWPGSPGGRRIELPTSPVVKTNPTKQRFFWRFSVSPESAGTNLFILLELQPGAGTPPVLPHSIFIATPPLEPTGTTGRGITFLQGPRHLLLNGKTAPGVLPLPDPEDGKEAALVPSSGSLPVPGDLISNGRFAGGLNHWQPYRGDEGLTDLGLVALHPHGLQLRNAATDLRGGVRQELNVKVAHLDRLSLGLEGKVERQTFGGTGPGGRQAPLAVTVRYTDGEGRDHVYWHGFYALEPAPPSGSENGSKVQQGEWFRFVVDLMRLEPKPWFIHSLALEGSGWPEREAWVRGVHLTGREETE